MIESRLIWGNPKECKYTIAIPTYKRNNLLIEAIYSATMQEGNDIQIIVVDNDPNNSIEKICDMMNTINDQRIAYYRNEQNIGMMGNWNRCIELAKGEYITILNDDDLLKENYFREVKAYIENIGEFGFVCTKYETIDLNGKKQKSLQEFVYKIINKFRPANKKINSRRFYYDYGEWGTLGILFSKRAIQKVGGFKEEWHPIADYWCVSNLAIDFDCYELNRCLSKRRWAVNASKNPKIIKSTMEKCRELRKILATDFHINKKLNLIYQNGREKMYLKNCGAKNVGFGQIEIVISLFIFLFAKCRY